MRQKGFDSFCQSNYHICGRESAHEKEHGNVLTSSFIQLGISRCIATGEHRGAGEGIMRERRDQGFVAFFCRRK